MKSQTKEFTVLSINREALSWAGYKDAEVSDRDMRRLAREIANDCSSFPFDDCLKRAAEALKLPKDAYEANYDNDIRLLLNAHLDEIARQTAPIHRTWFVGPRGFESTTNVGYLFSEIHWKTKHVSHRWSDGPFNN